MIQEGLNKKNTKRVEQMVNNRKMLIDITAIFKQERMLARETVGAAVEGTGQEGDTMQCGQLTVEELSISFKEVSMEPQSRSAHRPARWDPGTLQPTPPSLSAG